MSKKKMTAYIEDGVLTLQRADYIEDGIYITKADGEGWKVFEIPQYGGDEYLVGEYPSLQMALDEAAKLT
jgi:hypothetical protein